MSTVDIGRKSADVCNYYADTKTRVLGCYVENNIFSQYVYVCLCADGVRNNESQVFRLNVFFRSIVAYGAREIPGEPLTRFTGFLYVDGVYRTPLDTGYITRVYIIYPRFIRFAPK